MKEIVVGQWWLILLSCATSSTLGWGGPIRSWVTLVVYKIWNVATMMVICKKEREGRPPICPLRIYGWNYLYVVVIIPFCRPTLPPPNLAGPPDRRLGRCHPPHGGGAGYDLQGCSDVCVSKGVRLSSLCSFLFFFSWYDYSSAFFYDNCSSTNNTLTTRYSKER